MARTGDLQGEMGRDTNFPSVGGGGNSCGIRERDLSEHTTVGQSLSVPELFHTVTFLEWEKERPP